jgi:hypothetical protein
MAQTPRKPPAPPTARKGSESPRAARLAAALRANLARRKARARAAEAGAPAPETRKDA